MFTHGRSFIIVWSAVITAQLTCKSVDYFHEIKILLVHGHALSGLYLFCEQWDRLTTIFFCLFLHNADGVTQLPHVQIVLHHEDKMCYLFIYFSTVIRPTVLQRGGARINVSASGSIELEILGVRDGSGGGREMVPVFRGSW